MSNDVALLELAEPVEWSRRVRAVCLPGGADADRRLERRLENRRQPVLVAGWGLVPDDNGSWNMARFLSQTQKKVRLP